jgi:hypothetical protein
VSRHTSLKFSAAYSLIQGIDHRLARLSIIDPQCFRHLAKLVSYLNNGVEVGTIIYISFQDIRAKFRHRQGIDEVHEPESHYSVYNRSTTNTQEFSTSATVDLYKSSIERMSYGHGTAEGLPGYLGYPQPYSHRNDYTGDGIPISYPPEVGYTEYEVGGEGEANFSINELDTRLTVT